MSTLELQSFTEQVNAFSYEDQLMAMQIIIDAMHKWQTQNSENFKTELELLNIRKSGYATIRELLKDDEW